MAVTGFAFAWALLGAGAPTGTALLVAAAVLAGQLSVGWCNDWVDAGRDRRAGRATKPVVAGLVGRRLVGLAALTALAACVGLSLLLGPTAAAVHLVAVASAWAYDVGVKATPLSPLPYAVSFGLLPAVATQAVDGTWPPPHLLVTTALLGVAAHFANTVPDAAGDARVGVRGLPQRLGPRASVVVAALALAGGALVLLLASPRPTGPTLADGLLGVAVVLAGVGAVAALRPAARRGREVFWGVVGSAGLVVLAVLVG